VLREERARESLAYPDYAQDMKTVALLFTVLTLAGCVLLQGSIPSERKAAYLDNAHCDTTYGLLMDFGVRRSCPVIIQALDRYSTTNEVDVGHRIAILNAPYWHDSRADRSFQVYGPLVERALADPSPEVRSYFLHFVTRFPEDEALSILNPMLSDPDESVRKHAEEAIGRVKKPEQNKTSHIP